jgi:hypothetical protein
VQRIDRPKYEQALLQAGQKLSWDPKRDRSAAADAPIGQALTLERLLKECDADGDKRVSAEEWNAGKPGWEWLFPVVDADRDGRVEAAEYAAFQEYKARHPDWQSLRKTAGDESK